MATNTSRKSRVLSVRVSNELEEKIDKLYAHYTAPWGVRITKSAFVTWAVETGLEVIAQKMEMER